MGLGVIDHYWLFVLNDWRVEERFLDVDVQRGVLDGMFDHFFL